MLDLNAGAEPLWSTRAAYPLVLWQRGGVPTFCLEGTAITAGAAITWLRDALGIIRDAAESAALAASVPDAGGAWAVPAFQGLGTPYMDAGARAVLGGLSRATNRAHLVRAVLEGIAWRCREVYDALRADVPHPPPATLRADGGAARNDVLLQLQADALGLPVERPAARWSRSATGRCRPTSSRARSTCCATISAWRSAGRARSRASSSAAGSRRSGSAAARPCSARRNASPHRTPRSPTGRRRMPLRWTTPTREDPSTWARPS